MDNKKLWRVWGEYHKYPECCVDWFVSGGTAFNNRDHPSIGTGFVPCPKCQQTTKHMSRKEFFEWLGRDEEDFKAVTGSEMLEETLNVVLYDKEWKRIAEKHKFDYIEYLEWLENSLFSLLTSNQR